MFFIIAITGFALVLQETVKICHQKKVSIMRIILDKVI